MSYHALHRPIGSLYSDSCFCRSSNIAKVVIQLQRQEIEIRSSWDQRKNWRFQFIFEIIIIRKHFACTGDELLSKKNWFSGNVCFFFLNYTHYLLKYIMYVCVFVCMWSHPPSIFQTRHGSCSLVSYITWKRYSWHRSVAIRCKCCWRRGNFPYQEVKRSLWLLAERVQLYICHSSTVCVLGE